VDDDLRLWANNRARFNTKAKHPPLCLDVISAFDMWKWTPVISQMPLVAEHIGIGTRADMIAVDAAGTALLLELKCGFEKYLYKHNGKMRGPLAGVTNAPMNQHFLQVGLEKLIFRHCYGFAFPMTYVIQAIFTRGIIPHELPDWFIEREDAIWQYFCSEVPRVRAGASGDT
jgi:hypothetical protein